MSARETKQAARERELDREIEKYREVAWMALEQLEWAIGCLRSSGVAGASQIAAGLDRNRNQIATGIDRRGSHRGAIRVVRGDEPVKSDRRRALAP